MKLIREIDRLTRVRNTPTVLAFLTAVFSICVVVSNITAAKVCGFSVFEFDAGVLAYPITFLCIDLINEVWGAKAARKAVLTGILLQCAAALLIVGAINLPALPGTTDFAEQFATVLGANARIVIASMLAFLVAQLLDVKLFDFFRNRIKFKWIRSSGSSVISQIADSTVFTVVAFAGVVPGLGAMILTSYLVKALTSIAVTPFFYLFTRKGVDE